MHRSSIASRTSDELFINLSPATRAPDVPDNSKETAHSKSSSTTTTGENAIHLIPLVLILCAITLWIFSQPAANLSHRDHVLGAVKIKGLSNHHVKNNTASSSTMELQHLDQPRGIRDANSG